MSCILPFAFLLLGVFAQTDGSSTSVELTTEKNFLRSASFQSQDKLDKLFGLWQGCVAVKQVKKASSLQQSEVIKR